MLRPRRCLRGATVAGSIGIVLLLAAGGLLPTAPPSGPGPGPVAGGPSVSVPLPDAPFGALGGTEVAAPNAPAGSGRAFPPAPADLPMNVLVGLAGPNASDAAALVAAEYTPGSPLYHRYLSPTAVAARFGAPAAEIARAVHYFDGFGLTATPLGGATLIEVRGPADDVARAFGTSFAVYPLPGGRSYVGHSTPAVLPAGIAWSGAVGLGNASVPEPLAAPLSATAPIPGPLSSCTAGAAGLAPCQIQGAYNSSGVIANGTTGRGERIGIVDVYDGSEPQSQLAADLASFDAAFGLPNASVSYNYPVRTNQSLNGTSTGWGLEEALDVEWAHASAPGASIAMTFGTDSNAGLYEAVDWLVASHRTDVISLSWGENDVGIYNAYAGGCAAACNASTDGSYEVLDPVLAAAALEGITVVAASGDCGAADGTSGRSTNFPASDPYVTGVGGTELTVSAAGAYGGEVAWSGNASGATSPGCQNQGGSGGGFAPFPRPWWQNGTGVPTRPATRGVPDVAADAATAVEVYVGGSPTGVGGTSLATPIWAGFAALADQYAGSPLGFLDPSLYAILRGGNYSAVFHDIQSGSNGYAAGRGWDPVTGIGTPRVDRLLPALAGGPVDRSSLEVALTGGPLDGAAPLTAVFSIHPSGGSGSYPLEGISFGDGNASLAPNGSATHVYPVDGVYPAAAWVADGSGNTSVSDPVAVVVGGGRLAVTLTATPTVAGVGATVSFAANASGGTAPYHYLVTFGDGTYYNGSDPTVGHAYPAAGGYCADVVVSDSASPQDGGTSAEVAVAVGGAPAPTCPNETAPLTVFAVPNPAVRDAPADFPPLFEVDGGSDGLSAERLHSSDPYVAACQCTIFRAPGSYAVSLTATDGLGEVASNSTTVTVAPPLVGRFQASTQAGPAPLSVSFSAAASGGYGAAASSTRWAFGDGGTAVGADVAHTFVAPGVYVATADLEDLGFGNASEAFVIDVTAPGSTAPTVSATIAPAVNVSAGADVRFRAAASVPNATFLWSLGGGEGASAAAFNATLAPPPLSSARNLTIRLSVELGTGTPGFSVAYAAPTFFAIEAGGFLPRTSGLDLVAAGGPAVGTAPLAWSGSAAASGPGLPSVLWQLPNGTAVGGGRLAATFVRPGAVTVWAGATDPWNDSASIPFAVTVAAPPPPLAVRAQLSPLAGTAPLGIAGGANATGGTAPYGYRWSFGDGTGATGAAVAHTYTAPATYLVRLVVTDAGGGNVSVVWAVLVGPALPNPTPGPAVPMAALTEYLAAVVVAAGVATGAAIVVRWRRRPPATP